jgi:imidazolonepropionase-like amidohydrolase
MTVRVVLRPPLGEPVTRDIVDDGLAEPVGAAEAVLGEGWWALPGLVDAHSHIASEVLDYRPGSVEGAVERARAALVAGVTLLLDKGWTDDTAVKVVDLLSEGERPDIEAAGAIITSADGYISGFGRHVGAEMLEESVAVAAKEGRGWVKLVGDWPRKGQGAVANFTEEQLRRAVDVAAAGGARVAIHTMAPEVPGMAVRAGVDSIEHGLFLLADDIDRLGARNGMWVPTCLRVEATIAQLGASSSGGRLLGEGLANVARRLRDAVEAGVRVLAGTDLVGSPANVASEALRLLDYGLTPEQMVEAVSSAGLSATGRLAGFEVGAPADVVFFLANPLQEPAVLAHPHMVIRRGRVV